MDITVLKLVITLNFLLSLLYAVRNYRITRSHVWLFLAMSLLTAFILSFLRFAKDLFYINFEQYEHVIIILELAKINLIPFVTAFLLAAALIIGRERLSSVLPMDKKEREEPPYLRKGTTYLIKEETSQKGFHIFLDLLTYGYKGLGILRTHPDEVRREYHITDVPILWLSRLQVGENVIYPSIKVIEQIIEEFMENEGNHVIFLERLDYIISQRGFEKTLQFIQKLSSLIYVTKSIAVLHIDPLTIGERELLLIEKETKTLEKESELEEELAEILRYVYQKNVHGVKPNLKQITKELSLSRNTARKRISTLRLRNLVVLKEKGREKVLEITRTGEDLIR
ncbi:MAG: DUF835 domain-containing protein [Theionarchaea archaeon]|nr:DUF835 domain-containing protein [Theionarchaea archaeon]